LVLILGAVLGALLLDGKTAFSAVVRQDIASLARRSSLILAGEVLELRSFRAEYADIGEVILTDVRVRVDKAIKGQPDGEEVNVRLLGGQVGTTFQVCPDSARYEKGEKVLVFLREHQGALWNVGWLQGKYRLLQDGAPGVSATVEGKKGLPVAENIALDDLEARLRAYWESSEGAASAAPIQPAASSEPTGPQVRGIPDGGVIQTPAEEDR
jgi:hypothetical protein